MRKIFIAVSVVSLLSLTSPAHAGVVGTKCSNSGATLTSQGKQYVCKNMGGKLKWQNAPKTRTLPAYNNCLTTYLGGWNNSNDAQTNLNITNYCWKTFHP